MDLTELKKNEGVVLESCPNEEISLTEEMSVSLETEIPEVLYRGMKDFISTNPEWDQYRLMSSALANF